MEAIPQTRAAACRRPAGIAAQTLCAIGAADVYASAKTTGASINASVDAILSLVDAIRTVTPTSRDEDSRTWGPFPDKDHPGVTMQVTMFRELDATRTPWRWIYTISARAAAGRVPADPRGRVLRRAGEPRDRAADAALRELHRSSG